ncbi:hypothetical protein HDU90_004319 [Geranomyces variabilis]|nr:hypothetical protein HDU90_004319 [Geranomyces variabilis]
MPEDRRVSAYLRYKKCCRLVYETLAISEASVERMSKVDLVYVVKTLPRYIISASRCAQLREEFKQKYVPATARDPGHDFAIRRAREFSRLYDVISAKANCRLEELVAKEEAEQSAVLESELDLEDKGSLAKNSAKKKGKKGKKVEKRDDRATVASNLPELAQAMMEAKLIRQEVHAEKQELHDATLKKWAIAAADIVDFELLKPKYGDFLAEEEFLELLARNALPRDLRSDITRSSLSRLKDGAKMRVSVFRIQQALPSTLRAIETELIPFLTTMRVADDPLRWRMFLLRNPEVYAETYMYVMERNCFPRGFKSLEIWGRQGCDVQDIKEVIPAQTLDEKWLGRCTKRLAADMRGVFIREYNQWIDVENWAVLVMKIVYLIRAGKFKWMKALMAHEIISTCARMDLESIPEEGKRFLQELIDSKRTDHRPTERIESVIAYSEWLLAQ